MDKTKIEWADATWNPVTGCLHGCEYCYARRIANRFGLPYAPRLGDPGMEGACKYDTDEAGMDTMLELEKPYVKDGRKQPFPMGFYPTFHRYRLGIPERWEKPRTIFVCSMADLFGEWVPDEWIVEVFAACARALQHRYLFLTKNPARYDDLIDKGLLPEADNFWYGSTVTDINRDRLHWNRNAHTFMSCEPMLAPWNPAREPPKERERLPEWVIFGAETGNRAGKVTPKKEWIDNAVQHCRNMGAAVFMKDSLIPIVGADNMRREFPW